ncbi:phospholipid carrier-dependent glycosyltransferase [Algoriphagus sp. NF]|uniref:ArnT family glycosyltransferase n=1 Tax=Algoriphagus sp. NF TaxID=2992756 RepID=UPI00237BC59C|nr:phospholipid carrier-dependent glycosyltransferase [Algoriphagus sp. NF]MDE0560935.1 phospholipid carrier-dependent glycosyltransferase [Algoriphagus sp. NF]
MLLSSSSELKINPWILMVAYCLLIGPFVLNFHMHYPDEIYYRDAAVKMLQNGDYLTTYLGSGELRFKKPILTYWAVFAGFKLFGVNEFGSRIFFLLAGAGTVGLTFLLSKILFADRKIAGLSALIMVANPVLILSSGRSIPDVLLVLTMTLSAVGFVGLLRDGEKAHSKFIWAMYLGLALAFEVKGLPAAALGFLGILVLLFNPWNRVSLKKLFHLPALLLSMAIALFWFVAMWKIHGPTYLDSFLEDQVGIRVASRFLLILQNGLLALLLLLVMFIPWILLIAPKFRQTIKKAWKENPQFFLFAIVWGLAILGMGALTSKFYERYLLPVAPVLAVWIAWIGIKSGVLERIKSLKVASVFFLFMILVLTGVSLWINFGLVGNFWLRLQAGLGVIFLIYAIYTGLKTPEKLPKIISYTLLMIFFLLSSITYHISLPHQGTQAASLIQAENIREPIAFYGNLHAGSKIRMSLGPDYQLIDLPRDQWQEKAKDYQILILEDRLLEEMDLTVYEVKTASRNWDSKAIPNLLSQIHKAEFEELLEANSKKYYLLRKK